MHAPRDDRALEQVAAELREDPPAAHLIDAVAGPPDALQPAGDRLGRLDLEHEVHRAHVDPELERAGGDEAGQLARLQQLLDLRSLLAGERSVVGARDLRLGELVQSQRHALGRAAVVDEHDRRVVRPHELEQLRVDRGPDRRAVDSPPATGASGSRSGSTGPPGSVIDSTGTSMRRSSGLRTPASTILTCRCGPTR